MNYLILADVVMLIHAAFVVFTLAGGLTLLRWPKMIWLHVPAMVWGFFILVYQWTCPLTPLENWLLAQGGNQEYVGGFIAHYLQPIIYTAGVVLPLSLELGLVLITLVINGGVYYRVIRGYLSKG